MGKKRWAKRGQAGPEIAKDVDPVTRSIAVHGNLVAIATGPRWRVVDVGSQQLLHSDGASHTGAVRGLAFASDGAFLLTCGDDKTARVWRTADWSCVRVLKAPKKASACAVSADGRHVFFADRFGDVLCATTTAGPADAGAAADGAAAAAAEPSLLLGHLQAIISSLTVTSSSAGTPLLVSTDRDAKVRASVLPADPTKGAYEIQSYCLGHTAFVTCSAAAPVAAGAGQQQLLLSGGGDGTVRLWDVDSGKQLACYAAAEPPQQQVQQQEAEQAADPQQQQQQQPDQQEQQQQAAASGDAGSDGDGDNADADGEDDEQPEGGDGSGKDGSSSKPRWQKYERTRQQCAAVLSLAVSADGATVAATVEGQQEVQLLALDAAGRELRLAQRLALPGVANPAALAFDGAGRLWVVGGLLLVTAESAHVAVAARQGDAFVDVTADALPAGLRASLECRVEDEEAAAAAQQVGLYYHEGFKRKVYSEAEVRQRDERKKQRTDLREVERLAALRAAEEGKEAAAGAGADGK